MPNVEYFAPWFRSEALIRSMSHESWKSLSSHAQRVSRYIVCNPGEAVIGEGFAHPRRAERERYRAVQLEALEEEALAEYLRR